MYFTDSFNLCYKCIEKKIIPFYITGSDTKLLQRTVKTSPHKFIPYMYDISLYIDGNIHIINNNIVNNLLRKLNDKDILCFKHPDRNTLLSESIIVENSKLENSNITKIKDLWNDLNFNDDIGLTETNLLLRRHKNIINFSDYWSKCIEICRRDQLSLIFIKSF